MKRFILLLIPCIALLLSNCGTSKTAEQKMADSLALVTAAYPSFCQTLYLNILDAPANGAKTLATLHFGDFVTLTGDSSFVQSGSRITRYKKVMLSDRTEGWAVDDSLAIHALPAAPKVFFVTIYDRPDTTAQSGARFERRDFLATRPVGKGWLWASGYSEEAKKRISGFVKETEITTDSLEARFAGLYSTLIYSTITPDPILPPETVQMREEILNLLVNSETFKNTLIYQETYEGGDGEDPSAYDADPSEQGGDVSEEEGGGEPDNPGYGHAPVAMAYRSMNYSSRLITVVNNFGDLVENPTPKAYPLASLFYPRDGMNAKCDDCVILESYTQKGYYLCATQSGNDVRIMLVNLERLPPEQQPAYLDAMSFRGVQGLGGSESISFSSFMDPTLFIRHRDFHLWLHKNDNSDIFAKDASFSEEEVD